MLCGALFLDALDVSMVGVALPSISTDLGLSTSSLQWIVSAYVLGYGGFLLLGGRAADLLGRRRVFLISLGVFAVASVLGAFVDDGSLLIATRFIKGVAAAFTAPAGLSIITTTFAEGRARNKALSIYTATGATGFSLGLVIGGLLTEAGWRWVFLLPAPVALIALIAGLAPRARQRARAERQPPRVRRLRRGDDHGRDAAARLHARRCAERRLGLRAHAALVRGRGGAARSVRRARAGAPRQPLVRLGILRSGSLVRANLGAMALFGGWVGFQFIATLYMQQLRGWSPLETGLAIFPAGVLVAIISTRIAPLVMRFGVTRLIIAGMVSILVGYALFLPIGLNSSYALAMLPTFLLAGLGFALAFGPLNIAATNGIAPGEQGLAGGLLNTSFQFGGALALAVVAAVVNANTGAGGTPQALLDGFKPALVVPLIVGALGIVAMTSGLGRSRPVVAAEPEVELELEAEAA